MFASNRLAAQRDTGRPEIDRGLKPLNQLLDGAHGRIVARRTDLAWDRPPEAGQTNTATSGAEPPSARARWAEAEPR
jgi:hypothetical protein